MSDAKPTGRYRFRINCDWRGRKTLVLQMQIEDLHTSCVGGHVDSEWVKYWRDARLEDLEIEDGLPRFELKQAET